MRGEITALTAVCCMNRLFYLAALDHQKPILVEISSSGGLLAESLALARTMSDVGCPISTYSRGTVSGTAVVIAAHGRPGLRSAAPSARFRLTIPADEAHRGNSKDSLSVLKSSLVASLARDTGKSEREVAAWIKGGVEFTAQQALANGLIDAIAGQPTPPPP